MFSLLIARYCQLFISPPTGRNETEAMKLRDDFMRYTPKKEEEECYTAMVSIFDRQITPFDFSRIVIVMKDYCEKNGLLE